MRVGARVNTSLHLLGAALAEGNLLDEELDLLFKVCMGVHFHLWHQLDLLDGLSFIVGLFDHR